jgi:hypothetical protein
MGIFIIVLAICIIASGICYKLSDTYCNFTRFLSWVFGVYAFIALVILIGNSVMLITKDQVMKSEQVDGNVLYRLLQEDYNPENLNKALEFNARQQKAKIYNESFFTLCVEQCYNVDTIVIPLTKFLPNTKNTIDVNVTNK